MAERNYQTFRSLLRDAICNRTQAQFAQESGISAEHLSRMLNQETIHRPNRGTLSKIACAAMNGVTLQDLVDALDQDDGTNPDTQPSPARQAQAAKDFEQDFKDKAEATMKSLCHVLGQQSYPVITDSVTNYVSDIMSAASDAMDSRDTLSVAYEIGQDREHFGTYNKHAKRYVPIWLSMSDRANTAEAIMMAYFDELPCGDGTTRYVVHDVTCRVKAAQDQYGVSKSEMDRATDMLEGRMDYPEGLSRPEPENPDEPADPEVMAMTLSSALPYSLSFAPAQHFREEYRPKDGTPEERLLKSIFGDKFYWTETIDGFGFYIDPDSVPARLPEFLYARRKHILDAYDPDGFNDEEGSYDKLKSILDMCRDKDANARDIADRLDQLGYQDPNMMDGTGWPSAVATAMRAETGFPFEYQTKPEDPTGKFSGLSDQACILINTNDRAASGIQREAMVLATCRYARAMGVKRFGDILFTHVTMALRKPMTYVIKEQGPDQDSEECTGCAGTELAFVDFDRETSRPDATGAYMAELKDGRQIKLFWIDKPGIWIRAHKEWSHMVARFCPEPLPTEEK